MNVSQIAKRFAIIFLVLTTILLFFGLLGYWVTKPESGVNIGASIAVFLALPSILISMISAIVFFFTKPKK